MQFFDQALLKSRAPQTFEAPWQDFAKFYRLDLETFAKK